jgi:hypothetical protein
MKCYTFNASLESATLALGCKYTISNDDGGKYPKQISKGYF